MQPQEDERNIRRASIRESDMDSFEKVGYACLALVALCYLTAMFVGILAVGPVGIVGLIAIVGIGVLFIKVVRERLANREDDHYADKVDQ